MPPETPQNSPKGRIRCAKPFSRGTSLWFGPDGSSGLEMVYFAHAPWSPRRAWRLCYLEKDVSMKPWLVVRNSFYFPFHIWNIYPNWLIFFKIVKTTNQNPLFDPGTSVLGSWGRCRCEGHGRPPVVSESPRQARWKKWRRRLVPDRAYSADWDPAWPWSVMRLLANNFLVELFLIQQNWGIGHMLCFFEWSPLSKSKDRQEQIEPEMFINLQPRRFSKSAHCLKDMPIGSDASQSSSPAGRTVHFRLQIKCGVRNFAHVVHPASRLTQFGSTHFAAKDCMV